MPLHPQLVEFGSPAFVASAPSERSFLVPDIEGGVAGPRQGVKNRLSEFAHEPISDTEVSPNHSWRHRFRKVATGAAVSGNVIDAICGGSAKSVDALWQHLADRACSLHRPFAADRRVTGGS